MEKGEGTRTIFVAKLAPKFAFLHFLLNFFIISLIYTGVWMYAIIQQCGGGP